jgi:hypothetical protein
MAARSRVSQSGPARPAVGSTLDRTTAVHEAKAHDAIAAAFARLEDEDRREIGRGLMLTGQEPDGTLTLPYFIGLIVWPQMRPQTLYQLRQAALDGQCGALAAELPTEDPWGIVARALIELQKHADAGELTGELPDPTFEPRRA